MNQENLNCDHSVNRCDYVCPYCAEYSNPDMCDMERELKQANAIIAVIKNQLALVSDQLEALEGHHTEDHKKHNAFIEMLFNLVTLLNVTMSHLDHR